MPVYNIARLAGTDAHGRRRSKGDTIQGKEKRRRTISDAMVLDDDNKSANDSINALAKVQGAKAGVDASDLNRSITSLKPLKSARISKKVESSRSPAYGTRRATRLSAAPVETIATKLSAIGKRGKKAVDKGLGRISRELMRLQDTNEFAHIETRPVRYSVWSNGKYVDVYAEPETAPQHPRKKVKVDTTAANGTDKVDTEKQAPAAPAVKRPRAKKWLEKGLYAGQEAPIDISKGLTAQEKKKLATLPELVPSGKPNRTLPQPMYNGLRVLIHGRDFKLPFDICNPLPPGQPKPAAYRTMTKSEYPPLPRQYRGIH
jgi:histone-lysine N-methyltransferase ASH1L